MKNIFKALAIVAMFGFVACSGSGESTEAATDAPAVETPAAEAPAAETAPAAADTTMTPAATPAAGETKGN